MNYYVEFYQYISVGLRELSQTIGTKGTVTDDWDKSERKHMVRFVVGFGFGVTSWRT